MNNIITVRPAFRPVGHTSRLISRNGFSCGNNCPGGIGHSSHDRTCGGLSPGELYGPQPQNSVCEQEKEELLHGNLHPVNVYRLAHTLLDARCPRRPANLCWLPTPCQPNNAV